MSQPICSLLRSLVGGPRREGAFSLRRGPQAAPRSPSRLLITEPLEQRKMLSVNVSLSGGTSGTLIIDQAVSQVETIDIAFATGKVVDPADPTKSAIVEGVTVIANVSGGIPSNKFLPFLNPYTGAQVDGIRVLQKNAGATVRVDDQIGFLDSVVGGALWSVDYTTADLGLQTLEIDNTPSILAIASPAAVEVTGNFTNNDGTLTVVADSIVVAPASGSLTADNVTLDTATNGGGSVSFSGGLTANDTLTIRTNAVLDISTAVRANTTDLTLNAGGTQSGGSLGTVGSSPKFRLVAGGDVVFGLTSNTLGDITEISTVGWDVTLGTNGPVTQSGAINAAGFSITSLAGVTLEHASNDVDKLGISAAGTVKFVDRDEVELGAAGLGIAAGANAVTITTTGSLTQGLNGRVVAGTFTANINAPGSGNANLLLDSANNQVNTFIANNASAGGAITFLNTPVAGVLTLGDGISSGVTAVNGPVTITNGTGLTIASPVSAGTDAMALQAAGNILQNVGAVLTAQDLFVANKSNVAGAITLNEANAIDRVSITNRSTAGISFRGSANGQLAIGAANVPTGFDPGITAQGGTVAINANGDPLAINAPITGNSANVTLTADGGVTQATAAPILVNNLTVTNTTTGVVALDSASNDVANLAITNSATAGSVTYADKNDLSLKTGGGIVAGDSITLLVGGGFTSTPGNELKVTGATGQVSLTTVGTASIGGAVTAPSGVTVTAGTAPTVSGIAVSAVVNGGTGPVSLTATGGLTTNAGGAITGASVALDGAASVALAAAVSATGGGLTVTSATGPLVTSAAATLTAATGIVTKTAGDATFGGAVTATGGGIDVTAGVLPGLSDINVNAAFTAAGSLSLDATDAITSQSTIAAASVTGKSGGATTLGGAVTSTAGAVTFTSGGGFTTTGAAAPLAAAGTLNVTSVGPMSLSGTVSGAQVTLAAGTFAAAAGVNVLEAVASTAGNLQITATGGAVATGAKATLTATGGDVNVSGDAGATLAATAAGNNVAVTAVNGAVLVSQVNAPLGGATLAAANGVTQAAATSINALALVTTNTTAGGIGLASAGNSVGSFSGVNTAPGAAVAFVNNKSVVLTGIATANGVVDVTAAGEIALAGGITAGTGNVGLLAAGKISQAGTAAILGANLEVLTTVGDVLLGTCPTNDVDVLFGANLAAGGVFEFTDADDLGVTTTINPLTTNGGDVTIVSGQGGAGAMTIGGALAAGSGLIALEASSGITGLAGHAVTSTNGLALANNISGNITLASTGNSFPQLSAVNDGGDITIRDSVGALQLVNHGPTAGLQANNGAGAIILTVINGSLAQNTDAPVIARDATFTTEGTVTLDQCKLNDVVNLAIQNTGVGTPIDYVDADDLTIGVGGNGVVSTLGDITLTALTGAMTLGEVVTTSSASNTITLAAVGIRQTAGVVTTGNLIMNSSDLIDVVQPGNSITHLRAFSANLLDFNAVSNYQTGLDRVPVAPDTAGTTVAVVNNVATFNQPFTVTTPDLIARALIAGDVLVINGLPYRVKSVSGLNADLIPPDGLPANFPAGTSFTVLTPQVVEVAGGAVTLNSGGTLRVVAGIAGGMTLTADGVVEYVVSSTENAEPGSLRQMIGYTNDNAGTQIVNSVAVWQPMQIVFDEYLYPVQDIFVTAGLPAVQKPMDIIGERVEANVTDYERVGIDGTGVAATSIVNGLRYAAGSQGSSVSGLAVFGFDTGSGFQIFSGLNTLVNNYAGVRRDGVSLEGNKVGIELTGITATTNTIGTYQVDEALANVVGGNSYAGIVVRSGATANAIVGNYIGTDSLGTSLGNLGDGVVFEGANGNIVGARTAVLPDGTPAASNVIANNNNSGVRIVNSRAATLALGNLIENNRIQDNAINGIEITGSTFQAVGGSQPRQSNQITGQLTGSGVRIAQSADISVVANFIGTNSVGTSGLGNAASGVMIDNSLRTVVNGGNRIGSNGTGVTIRNGSTATRIEGNWIGTDSLDTPLGNVFDGVRIDRSIGNFVRSGNTIANNGVNGVNITDSTAAAVAQGNFVTGNLIVANGDVGTGVGAGIRVAGGARHRLGQAGAANVIIANGGEGILVERSPLTGASVGVVIQANYVGTNANEEADPALGNTVGIRLTQANAVLVSGRNVVANNLSTGVSLQGTSGSQIGAALAGAGNVIVANGGNGVMITSAVGSGQVRNSGNSVIGNEISGNGGSGVLVQGVTDAAGASTTTNVLVGVSAIPGKAVTGAANAIHGNAGDGVRIDGAQGVLVAGNSIYENAGLPIRIVNGGNRGAAAPSLTRAVLVQPSNSLTQAVVEGTFAQTGSGTVSIVNGRATFSVAQPTLQVGGVVTVGTTGYTIAQKISNTVFLLSTNTTLTVAGTGRVAANRGVATFSVAQAPSLVGQSIGVAGRMYVVTSLSSDGRTAQLAGGPTFAVSSFVVSRPFAFGVIAASVVNQQFVVDVFLNAPADGNPTTGTGYGMRTFIGRITVTVTAATAGRFSGALNLPVGVSAVGQYVTATATTMRASAAATPYSTSQVTSRARQLVFAGPTT